MARRSAARARCPRASATAWRCLAWPALAASAAGVQAAGGTNDARSPTFCGEIAPIVHSRCATCHRPDGPAPFPLLEYEDVRKRAAMIARVVTRRLMPPWPPAAGHGDFEDARALAAEEIATIAAWVEAGAPEGDPARLPPVPGFHDGWQLGEPDLVVGMPQGFEVPAAGPDLYRNFVIPIELDGERFVTSIEVRPSTRGVLHHVVFFFDESGEARRADGRDGLPGFTGLFGDESNLLGGWATGRIGRRLRDGLGFRLPARCDLVMQSHLHPSGKPAVERTLLGLHFAAMPPARTLMRLQLPAYFGLAAGLDIPPGASDYRIRGEFRVPVDAEGVTIAGHAHLLCRSMEAWVTRPGSAERESIFAIERWDFDWQDQYHYREPLALPKGSLIEVEIAYDNSAANPANPHDPPRRVQWGESTTDEMGSILMTLVPAREADAPALRSAIELQRLAALARDPRATPHGRGLLERLALRLPKLDRDGDGTVSRAELPAHLLPYLARLDLDGDGAIGPEELAAIAALSDPGS